MNVHLHSHECTITSVSIRTTPQCVTVPMLLSAYRSSDAIALTFLFSCIQFAQWWT